MLQAGFFFGETVEYDDKAFAKRIAGDGATRLAELRPWLAARESFDAATLERETQAYLAERGLGLGDIVHALRVAVTGTASGPGLFDSLSILGKEICLLRIDRALEKARAQQSAP